MDVKQRKNREFDSLSSIDDVINVLKSQFSNRKLYIKFASKKIEVAINEYLDDNSLMLVTDPEFNPGESFVVYGLSNKYIEVDFAVKEVRTAGYFHCTIKSAKRAAHGRRDLRFKVSPEDVVASNFRVSKHTIDVTGFNIPTSIKVVLEQFHSQNAKLSDIVRVDILGSKHNDPVLDYIKKTGKSVLVEDAGNQESYNSANDDFVNLEELYSGDLNSYVIKNVEKGYKSIIIVPVLYISEDATSIPFAFIQLISKSEHFTMEKVLELKDLSFKLVDRIRDANTLLIPVHQDLINISKGGVKIKITNDELKQYLVKTKGFVFDIIFKLQAPITIYGDIRVSYTDEKGNVYVGVDFEGNSSRKDEMKRFLSIIKPMEEEYKANLIRSLKK